MKRFSSTVAALFVALQAGPAGAHSVGLSRGEYRVSGSSLEANLVFARPELAAAVSLVGGRGVSGAELLAAAPGRLGDAVVRGLEILTAAGPCAGRFERAALTEQDGVELRAAYECPGRAGPLTIRLQLLTTLSIGHRHLATIVSADGHTVQTVLYESHPELQATLGDSEPASTTASLFLLGIQHILTGYDHLLFLFGLVLVGGRLRPLVVAVTAFTLAHSITLAVALLGTWAPSPGLVEPAIALSIAYVGVENWFVRDASRRWLITFPFGLVHGFGFASALKEISLPAGQLPQALACFNAGVEAGQLAVLALVLPAVLWLGRDGRFADRGVKLTSTAIAVAGVCWFVARLG